MTPKQIKSRRHDYGLSVEQFAALVGCAAGRTVRRWEKGSHPLPTHALRILELLELLPAGERHAYIIGVCR